MAKKTGAELDRDVKDFLSQTSGSARRATGDRSRLPATSRSRTKPGSKPWAGTIYNERVYLDGRAGVVSVYLDGVRGVSPIRAGFDYKQIAPAAADAAIARARKSLAELAAQKPPAAVRISHDSHVRQLRDLIKRAEAVRSGRAEQKMTDESYAELMRSLGVRR